VIFSGNRGPPQIEIPTIGTASVDIYSSQLKRASFCCKDLSNPLRSLLPGNLRQSPKKLDLLSDHFCEMAGAGIWIPLKRKKIVPEA
jgi:hypothetical protein